MRMDILPYLTLTQRVIYWVLSIILIAIYMLWLLIVMALSLPLYPYIFICDMPDWLQSVAGGPGAFLVRTFDEYFRKKAVKNKERREK